MEKAEDYILENLFGVDNTDISNCMADYSHIRVINLLERLKVCGVISEETFLKHFENEIKLTENYKQ